MRFPVHTLRRADQDVREIVRWIAEHSRPGAEAWRRAYERMIARLADHADELALADEDPDFHYYCDSA